MKHIRVDIIRESLKSDAHFSEEFAEEIIQNMSERSRVWAQRVKPMRKAPHGRRNRVRSRSKIL